MIPSRSGIPAPFITAFARVVRTCNAHESDSTLVVATVHSSHVCELSMTDDALPAIVHHQSDGWRLSGETKGTRVAQETTDDT